MKPCYRCLIKIKSDSQPSLKVVQVSHSGCFILCGNRVDPSIYAEANYLRKYFEMDKLRTHANRSIPRSVVGVTCQYRKWHTKDALPRKTRAHGRPFSEMSILGNISKDIISLQSKACNQRVSLRVMSLY